SETGAESLRFLSRSPQKIGRLLQNLEAPVMEQADVRGEQHGFPWIVRDEDGGLAESAGNTQELLLNLMPRHRIESAERLVEQQRLLVRRKRAGDADPLPLPAGQLPRIPIQKLFRRQVEHGEQLADAAIDGFRL